MLNLFFDEFKMERMDKERFVTCESLEVQVILNVKIMRAEEAVRDNPYKGIVRIGESVEIRTL